MLLLFLRIALVMSQTATEIRDGEVVDATSSSAAFKFHIDEVKESMDLSLIHI